jgi:hypothetical protein
VNTRTGTVVAAILIVVVGFAIGGWLAVRARGSTQQVNRVAITSEISTPRAHRATPTARPITTAKAIATDTRLATPMPRATPTAAAMAATPAPAALQGSWQLDEANVQVGTIVWGGNVTAAGNAIELNMHKQRVGGRPAVPCERQTGLHASFAVGTAVQTVPFREVNCNGVVSTGEIHVTSFNAGSFSGSFSQNGANLGSFTARKL